MASEYNHKREVCALDWFFCQRGWVSLGLEYKEPAINHEADSGMRGQ